MKNEGELKKFVILSLSEALESLLGRSGVRVLQFHLGRRLGGDIYEAFYESPSKFYEALESFMGAGAEALMRLVAGWLIQNGRISNLTPEEFVKLLREGGEASETILRKSFIPTREGFISR